MIWNHSLLITFITKLCQLSGFIYIFTVVYLVVTFPNGFHTGTREGHGFDSSQLQTVTTTAPLCRLWRFAEMHFL